MKILEDALLYLLRQISHFCSISSEFFFHMPFTVIFLAYDDIFEDISIYISVIVYIPCNKAVLFFFFGLMALYNNIYI